MKSTTKFRAVKHEKHKKRSKNPASNRLKLH